MAELKSKIEYFEQLFRETGDESYLRLLQHFIARYNEAVSEYYRRLNG